MIRQHLARCQAAIQHGNTGPEHDRDRRFCFLFRRHFGAPADTAGGVLNPVPPLSFGIRDAAARNVLRASPRAIAGTLIHRPNSSADCTQRSA